MADYEFTLRDYWQILQKRRWVFGFAFVAFLSASVIVTNMQEPVYEASARVAVSERRAGLTFEQWLSAPGSSTNSQARLITSRPVMERVVLRLGLAGPAPDPETLAAVADGLVGSTRTMVIVDSNMVRVSYSDSDPRVAADVVNMICESFIGVDTDNKNRQAREFREYVEAQYQATEAQLREAEATLRTMREAQGATGAAVALKERVEELQHERLTLLRLYTPQHPDIRALDQQIENVNRQMAKFPRAELDFAQQQRQVDVHAKSFVELTVALQKARLREADRVQDVVLVEPAIPPAFPVRPDKRLALLLGIAGGLLLGLIAAFLGEQLDTSIGTVEAVEQHLKVPVLGVIPYLRTGAEEDSWFKRPWFAATTRRASEAMRSQLVVNYPSKSTINEAYRMIGANLHVEELGRGGPAKFLLVTSAEPKEGKSVTTANLALTLGQMGDRTLLMDVDLRRPSQHRLFGLRQRSPGLSDLLMGAASLDEVVLTLTDLLMGDLDVDKALKTPRLDNLHVIPSGSSSANPPALLSSDRLTALLKELESRYDVVLLDSPPVLAVSDAVILAPKVSGVVLVYRVRKTSKHALFRARAQLQTAKAVVKGIVLNHVKPESRLDYPYYYYPYQYYGQPEVKERLAT